ncbi:MAG TPA: hypothetical protein VGG57_18740 [Stellaceae bacterium]
MPFSSVSEISTIDRRPACTARSAIVPPAVGLGGVCPSPIMRIVASIPGIRSTVGASRAKLCCTTVRNAAAVFASSCPTTGGKEGSIFIGGITTVAGKSWISRCAAIARLSPSATIPATSEAAMRS